MPHGGKIASQSSSLTSYEAVQREPVNAEPLLRRAILLLALPLVLGFALAQAYAQGGSGDPDPAGLGVFVYLIARHEPIHFAILLVACAALFAVSGVRIPLGVRFQSWAVLLDWRAAALLGFVAFVATSFGSRFILHSYPLAMDEFGADFQARLFAAGQVTATIPREWAAFVEALTPIYIAIGPDGGSWTSGYLPVAAGIRALFVLAGVPQLTNPVLAGLTIPVVWLVGRRLWPHEPSAAWVATLLLAVSPQFLFTSMTAYAMPAHLLFNLTWLYLYLVGTRVSLVAASMVGVLAMGLHQPNVHALFVAPFLLRLVLQRRWRTTGYFAAVYLLGLGLWVAWLVHFNPTGSGLAGTYYALNSLFQLLIQPLNLGLILSWQSIAMTLLALVGLMRWRRMSVAMRDIALGLAFTLSFYVFVSFDQGHGWGYRYAYAVLGNLALLAGQGWTVLNGEWRRSRGPAILAFSVLMALAVQVPIRAVQTESFVRPFADSMAFIRSLPTDVALVRDREAWYSRDLVRNDPWLTNAPRVMFERKLTDAQILALQATSKVRRVEAADLARLGMIVAIPP